MSLDWFTNRKKCRNLLYLMVRTMVSCRCSLQPARKWWNKIQIKKHIKFFEDDSMSFMLRPVGVATHYPFMAKSLKIGPFFSPFYLLLKPNGEIFILSTVLFILFPMFMNKWSFGQFCNVPVKQQQIHFTLIVAPQLPVGENPWIDSGHFGGNPCSLMGKTMGKPVFISFNPRTWIQP